MDAPSRVWGALTLFQNGGVFGALIRLLLGLATTKVVQFVVAEFAAQHHHGLWDAVAVPAPERARLGVQQHDLAVAGERNRVHLAARVLVHQRDRGFRFRHLPPPPPVMEQGSDGLQSLLLIHRGSRYTRVPLHAGNVQRNESSDKEHWKENEPENKNKNLHVLAHSTLPPKPVNWRALVPDCRSRSRSRMASISQSGIVSKSKPLSLISGSDAAALQSRQM